MTVNRECSPDVTRATLPQRATQFEQRSGALLSRQLVSRVSFPPSRSLPFLAVLQTMNGFAKRRSVRPLCSAKGLEHPLVVCRRVRVMREGRPCFGGIRQNRQQLGG